MKKRIRSILLTLCMVLCLVPTSVFAEGETTKTVATEQELVDALADLTVDVVQLDNSIQINETLLVSREVTLDLDGSALEMTGSGSVIRVADGGHLTLTDSYPLTSYVFTPDANGLWKMGSGGTEIVNGGIITGGNASSGGGVYIEEGGQFTMNGGSIVGCYAGDRGGGVLVDCLNKSSKFKMNRGAIIGCVAKGHGGGVETNSSGEGIDGEFIMNGGVIEYCVAEKYGGVLCSGPFVMNGGTIRYCRATEETDPAEQKGGVFLSGDGLNMLNGTIISEDAVDTQYIFVHRPVTIGANADIRANMYLNGYTIALADGVTSKTIYGKITNGCYVDGLAAVTYQVNGADYATQILRSGSATIRPADPTVPAGQTFDGWYKTYGTKWDFTTALAEDTTLAGWLYVPVTNETELTAALQDDTVGNIKLMNNIELSNELKIENRSDLILDLNGYVLSLKDGVGGSIFSVVHNYTNKQPMKLTIMDNRPDALHKFTPDDKGLWVWDKDTGTGTETVYGGVITGGNGEGGSGRSGGAITVGQNTTVVMEGGNIVGCSAANCGGAVSIRHNSTFTMNGGSIVGCKTGYYGGGVYVSSGVFEMNGDAAIIGCIAESDVGGGGGVCVHNDTSGSTFTMNGGSITGCKAVDGSGVYLDGSRMNANGGTVDGTVGIRTYNSSGASVPGVIQSLSNNTGVTLFKQDVTNAGEIKYGIFSGTVTVGYEGQSGKISGGEFTGPIELMGSASNEIAGGTFSGKVTTDAGKISGGIFNGEVEIRKNAIDYICAELAKGTCNGLIRNGDPKALFYGVSSPLGIVGEDPGVSSGLPYYKVNFALNGGTMDNPERYFYENTTISNKIEPNARAGYFFAGWYKADGTAWNHTDDKVSRDLTLTAHWTACDHSGHTGAVPTCTDTVICTVCNGTIPALGHDWGEWTSNNNNTHTRICKRDNTYTETKDCSGGEATCGQKAVCADCGKAYGEVDPANHKGGRQEWTTTAATHEQKWNCCGAVTVASKAHTWSDGVCRECGYVCLHDDTDKDHICDDCDKAVSDHTGGTATCKDKAACEVCGKTYGELDAKNHANLVHVPAKAATKDAEGNIAYWYCEDCGKYYSDADATRAITKAATVTAKLPDDSESPQTGDNSNLMLWIALLFISGGVVIGTTVVGKKKKHNS